jgi:hypothetical protein
MQLKHEGGGQYRDGDEPKINATLAVEHEKLHPAQKLIDATIIQVRDLFIGWYRQETIQRWYTDDINEEYKVNGNE